MAVMPVELSLRIERATNSFLHGNIGTWKIWMRALILDLNCAVRTLRRTPFFTSVVTAILALGMAFNAIVFSIVDSVLLHSLPYPEASRLVILRAAEQHRPLEGDLAATTFFFVRDHAKFLQDVTAIYPSDAGVNISGGSNPSYVKALRVSRNFFHLLRTMPLRGRVFDDKEDVPNGPRVAVVSSELWNNLNKKQPEVGGVLRINGEEYALIGVMPRGFRSYPEADLWLPLQLSPATADPGADYRVIARIKDEASLRHAQAELQALSREYPLPHQSAERTVLEVERLQAFETRDVRQHLIFLLCAVFFVQLIASANTAMLLLVRASARTHEIAMRYALGSSRRRLFQIFFVESALLSFLGGLLGIILAKDLLPVAVSMAPPGLPLMRQIDIDWGVVLFTFGTSAFTALLFGIVPATRISWARLNQVLGETTSQVTSSVRKTRAAQLLLIVQTALTLVLFSGALLLFRHLLILETTGPGFDVQQTWVAQVSLAARNYQTTAPTTRLLDDIVRRIQSLPSLQGAATINGLPLENGLNMPIHPVGQPEARESVEYRLISPRYFAVMRIPLTEGRPFTENDISTAQPVAIINETLARKWWAGSHASSHSIVLDKALGEKFMDKPRLIVGISADIHQSSLEQSARPTVFVPVQQAPDAITKYVNQYFLTSIVTKVSGRDDISRPVRSAVQSADPELSVASFRSLSQVVKGSFVRDRFYAYISAIFGAFALLITAMGLYALMSYQVASRTRAIALHMAFGARRSQIVILIVRQGVQIFGIGAALGMAGAVFFNHLFSSMFYNLESMAPGALGNAILFMALIAVGASLLAAFRIMSIEPMVVLRGE